VQRWWQRAYLTAMAAATFAAAVYALAAPFDEPH
jgi:hypothetical protein